MSSPVERTTLLGVIYRNGRPVGGVQLPEPSAPFLQSFNELYAEIGLRIEVASNAPRSPELPGTANSNDADHADV